MRHSIGRGTTFKLMKKRISIPTNIEKILLESSGALVLTAHVYKCLLLSPPVWEPIQEKIMNLSSFERKSSGLQRLLVGFGRGHHS